MINIREIIRKDPTLFISVILMCISLCWVKIDKSIFFAVDWNVIIILFSLMVVIQSLKEESFFDVISVIILKRLKNTRILSISLILMCFFSSMIITNDVALITFVPLTLILLRNIENEIVKMDIIILETAAANLGSQFTPLGNPQNLYIYTFYNTDIFVFIKHMFLITAISLLIVIISSLFVKKIEIKEYSFTKISLNKRNCIYWIFCFFICVLSVLKIIPYLPLPFIFVFLSILLKKRTIFNVDYNILLTFIFLFIFIDNLLKLEFLNIYLIPIFKKNIFLSGIFFSQIISNVPATILLAPLTNDWKTLIYSVNISGMGTIIASMASLISYKFYVLEKNSKKEIYLKRFTIYNFLILFVLIIIGKIILK